MSGHTTYVGVDLGSGPSRSVWLSREEMDAIYRGRNYSLAESLEHIAMHRTPPYAGPTLHEYISASHSMFLAAHVARRSPPRPRYVHCWGCRVPVTPSGRKALITEPPTGSRKDVDALCGIIRHHRLHVASNAVLPRSGDFQ